MKVHILSGMSKTRGEFTKERVIEARVFVYDEECFWFTYKDKRFGFSIPEILKLRDDTLKSFKRKMK